MPLSVRHLIMWNIVILLFAFTAVLGAPRQGSRIVGGNDAKKGNYPYQISLQQVIIGFRQHICGGSIIKPNIVLTAGHCVIPFGQLEVVAGEHDLGNNDGTEQAVKVSRSHVHPKYSGDVGPYDIALLILAQELTINEYVKPIGLPEAGSIPTGYATLTGWGSTSSTNYPTMPNILQEVKVPIVEYDDCRKAFGDSPLDPTNVCTGPLTGGTSACSGDSGGPLVQNSQLIGIVSWGVIPCGSVNAPSVYTRVSAYIDWIKENSS